MLQRGLFCDLVRRFPITRCNLGNLPLSVALPSSARYSTVCSRRHCHSASTMFIDKLDTPALLLDLDVFERNCDALVKKMSSFPGVAIRPHAKAHKCPDIARAQLRLLGATGVCCQKVSEAEALVAGGVNDILVSNEVVSPPKLARLARLAAEGAAISMCVDDAGALRTASQAAQDAGICLGVLVEVNVGQDRCGVDSPEDAVALAVQATDLGGLEYRGIQAYHGGIQHVRRPADRAHRADHAAQRARAAIDALTAAGLTPATVTGGGSGTYAHEAASGLYTEVQPGSFGFGDVDYGRNEMPDGSQGEWEQSLFVLTQVMSRSPARRMAVCDAGTKAVSVDSGPPAVPRSQVGGAAVEYGIGGDEHGLLLWPHACWQDPGGLPLIGDLLKLVPGHCDPTFNLYDEVYAIRGDTVEEVYKIAGRGPGR